MSRKDYIKFADMLRRIGYLDPEQKEQLINDVAGLFQADNGSFNRERFINACKYKDKEDERART